MIDQVWRGRSAGNPSVINSVKLGKTPADQLPPVVFGAHEEAWAIFRFGPEYPKVFPGMQFPLEALRNSGSRWCPIGRRRCRRPIRLCRRFRARVKLDGTVLMSHSQSGIYPFQTAALNTKGIAGIVSIEPGACPAADGDLRLT